MKKRPLTEVESAECKKLRAIYNEKKRDLGLSQERLGELIGITQSGVNMYLSGKNALNLPIARQFADALNVPIGAFSPRLASDLLEIVRSIVNSENGSEAKPSRITVMPKHTANAELTGSLTVWSQGDPLGEDEVDLPYYEEVEFSAGNGMTEVIEVADRKLRFSNETLRSAGVDPRSAAVARIRGRSMERLILDGAAIGFDMSDTSIYDGEIYAFNHDGMLRVKYLYRTPGGAVRVRSENSEEFPDELMTAEQWASEVNMLGRVFWWSTVRRSPRRLS